MDGIPEIAEKSLHDPFLHATISTHRAALRRLFMDETPDLRTSGADRCAYIAALYMQALARQRDELLEAAKVVLEDVLWETDAGCAALTRLRSAVEEASK